MGFIAVSSGKALVWVGRKISSAGLSVATAIEGRRKKSLSNLSSNSSPEKVPAQLEPLIAISVRTQSLIKDAIPTGGTIASYYAKHRISFDVDHLLYKMTEEIDEILLQLQVQTDWKPYSIKNVCVLGKLGGVEVGFRQMFRKKPIQTIKVMTNSGEWEIPTIEEITSFKAVLTARRNNVRDYLDFAALSEAIGDDEKVMKILTSLNEGYSTDWTFEVSKSLSDPNPSDLDSLDLSNYKGLEKKWQDWNSIKLICQKYGKLLASETLKQGYKK